MHPRASSAIPRVRAGFLLLSGSAGELCSELILFNSALGLGTGSPGCLENGTVASLAFSFALKKGNRAGSPRRSVHGESQSLPKGCQQPLPAGSGDLHQHSNAGGTRAAVPSLSLCPLGCGTLLLQLLPSEPCS